MIAYETFSPNTTQIDVLDAVAAAANLKNNRAKAVVDAVYRSNLEAILGTVRTAEAATEATVPVSVHMDHTKTPEITWRAADLGRSDEIMVDMSHYECQENLGLSRELVGYMLAVLWGAFRLRTEL